MATVKKFSDIGRVSVEGMYMNPSTYVLFDSNGEEFLTIRDGEEFQVADRTWIANRVPNKYGHGTVLLCSNWEDSKVFHLLHKKKGTWALTLNEAKRGIFMYPRNLVEQVLSDKGYGSQKVVYTSEPINSKVAVGGKIKIGRNNYPYLYLATDGQIEVLPHKKADAFYEVKVSNASFVVETFRNKDTGVVHPKKVILQKDKDFSPVAKVLGENLGTKWLDLK